MHYDSEIDLRKYHYQESFTRGSNSMMVPKVSSLSWKLKARIAINEGLTTNVKIIVCQICEKKIFHEVTSGATTNGHLSSSTDAKTASPLSRKMYFWVHLCITDILWDKLQVPKYRSFLGTYSYLSARSSRRVYTARNNGMD